MSYESELAFRTLRREGLVCLCKQIGAYFHQLFKGARFLLMRLPRDATPAELVDFSFNAAGGLLRMWQVRSEIIQLTDLVGKRRPKVLVEIGTALGGTLFLWCRLADPEAVIVSIDLPAGIHGGGYPYWMSWIYRRFPLPAQKLHLLRGDSHQPDVLSRLKRVLPGDGKIDFLFIDGDHTYDGVNADFQMYSGLVRPGGLIVFHDICKHSVELNCHVDRFWQEVKNERQVHEFVHDLKQGICGIGVVEV
jgi:cephalosporin hydroxylase